MFEISRDTMISEILSNAPEAMPVFQNIGPYKRYGIGGQRPRRPILLYHVIQSLYYATSSVS